MIECEKISLIKIKEKSKNLVDLIFNSDNGIEVISFKKLYSKNLFKKGDSYIGYFEKRHIVPETMEYITLFQKLINIYDFKGNILWKKSN